MATAENSFAPPGRSCLYECRVMHQRFVPRSHRFEYGIFMLAVDLAELPAVAQRLRFFSHNRRNAYEFRDSDHLVAGADAPDLRSQLSLWLGQQNVVLPPDARVLLVTLPRVFGYLFAPVSFYFCHRADGTPLCAVAEVQNTFGELKPYLIPVHPTSPGSTGPESFRVVVPKEYYVSPFSDLELNFDFQLRTPGEQLVITVNDVTADQTVLISTLTGKRRPLTDRELARLTLKYPLVTLRVITLIHWQALNLWWKRVPWHAKAAQSEKQLGVYRPHVSLKQARSAVIAPTLPPAESHRS